MSEVRRAVVVGVSEYQNKTEAELQDLSGAEYDAQEIWDKLMNPDVGGFNKEKSHLLKGKDAKCARIRRALSDVFYKTEKCDIALFYFSGHGRELDCYGEGYIAPYDMSYDHPIVYGIKMSELRQILSASYGPERVNCPISILDCCYSGISTAPGKGGALPQIEDQYYTHLDVTKDKGVIMIASSGKDEESTEILEAHKEENRTHAHGAFTYYLLEGLDGKAKCDNARISVHSLFTYARDQLAKPPRKQRVEMSLSSSVGADQVFLASISNNTRIAINHRILELQNNYNSSSPSTVVNYSVPRVAYILRYDKRNEIAKGFKKKIEKDIQEFADPEKWFSKHYLEIEPQLPSVAQILERLLISRKFKPEFDIISNLDQTTLCLLTFVYNAAEKNWPVDVFITYTRQYEKPKIVAPKAGFSL